MVRLCHHASIIGRPRDRACHTPHTPHTPHENLLRVSAANSDVSDEIGPMRRLSTARLHTSGGVVPGAAFPPAFLVFAAPAGGPDRDPATMRRRSVPWASVGWIGVDSGPGGQGRACPLRSFRGRSTKADLAGGFPTTCRRAAVGPATTLRTERINIDVLAQVSSHSDGFIGAGAAAAGLRMQR